MWEALRKGWTGNLARVGVVLRRCVCAKWSLRCSLWVHTHRLSQRIVSVVTVSFTVVAVVAALAV